MHEHNEKVNALVDPVKLPKMAQVRQIFEASELEDAAAVLHAELNREAICQTVKPGMSICVTAGSRGICHIDLLIRETVAFLKALGAKPFIIPAMGSHGGAVAEGQKAILEGFGITEETMGCPIRASMEVVQFSQLEDGTPCYIDRYAHEADGIVVINRVKPHTGFRGRYESGLFKMMCIGLGKQKGAETVHNRGRRRMGESIELIGNQFIEKEKILFGVAILENAFDRTYALAALLPDEIREKEPNMLIQARSLMPRIIPENLDVLVIDYIGKNISGTGMDTNITKSFSLESGISREGRAKKIAVLDITEQSHGAAVGLGAADTTTHRMFEKMDFNTTYPNLLTTGGTDSAKIPMVFDDQCRAIKAAVKTAIGSDKEHLRIIRIQDTLHLETIWVSEAILDELRGNPHFEILSEPQEMSFDEDGNLF